MASFRPLKVFISSNSKSGGPNTFISNFKKFFENNNKFFFEEDLSKSDLVLLIGENYLIQDLLLGYLYRKKLFLRLDGRRFNFLSKVFIGRQGNKGKIKFLKSIIFELKVIFAYFFVNRVIYQSKYTREQWLKLEEFLKKNYAIIINPCDVSKLIKYKNISENFLSNYQLKPYKYVVISKGFIHKSFLLDSAYRVLNNFGIRILVFGDYELELKKEYPLIKFFGYVKQDVYKKYLNDCFAFLCVENNACCPNALIEAQIIGKPIIGPNNGSLPEMCPSPEKQLLNNNNYLDLNLEHLVKEYLNNYGKWVKKSIHFSLQTFGSEQYEMYSQFFNEVL